MYFVCLRGILRIKITIIWNLREKRLRERIYKLRHYLLNGVTSISKMNQIEKYVQRQQELKQDRDERVKRKRNGNDAISIGDDDIAW